MITAARIASCGLLLALPWSPAMAVEEPDYTIERAADGYELRRYPPLVIASTAVQASAADAGNRAFRVLAGYIFGDNRA
ncbi:MAG TPA: heme-binding protein, partial [Steroidobacteraceae bacterium]|nr:heme-binding protein [Steroidobacteraceae bacterium]